MRRKKWSLIMALLLSFVAGYSIAAIKYAHWGDSTFLYHLLKVQKKLDDIDAELNRLQR